MTYRARRAARHDSVTLRGLEMHLTRWGPEPTRAMPPVILLHGFQDNGATFQFLVDRFDDDWPLVALDWRGFGGSAWCSDGYWFPDYLADLDALLGHLSPGEPARLIGHSMGGNIACLYAGVRPERVRCLVNLEGVGLPRTQSAKAPERLRRWLSQVSDAGERKSYESIGQLIDVIRFRFPRLSADHAEFVARAWSTERSGRLRLSSDPRHRWVSPTLYERDQAAACWAHIAAPSLLLIGRASDAPTRLGVDGTEEALRRAFPGVEIAYVDDAGHMLHIERPEAVAPLVERFLRAH